MKDKITIKKDLYNLADETYKEFQSKLCPGVNNIIGIRVPDLRQYAKELIKNNSLDEVISNIDNEIYEEIMLQGMVIGLSKIPFKEKIKYIEKFIPQIDNWGVCDVFCAGIKPRKEELKEVWKLIEKYIKSKKEYEARFSIVMMLDYFVIEEYIDVSLEKLDNVKSDKYYVQMAVAWAISVCYIKFPEKTMEYLKKSSLDNFTYNKAIQKIRESNRVSKQEKEILNEMKRRDIC